MSLVECYHIKWMLNEPFAQDAWERSVHRCAPDNFCVEMLGPVKHDDSYSFGFRIHPVKNDDVSVTFRRTSGKFISSTNEYDIWRKWEDCLLFQDILEAEYSRAAREKRNRLVAGKGIKKNGIYIHSDQAASWESLPFGPNPNDIARDIHSHIPKLSKTGFRFRLSQEIVNQRHEEIRNMMQALLQDDLPTLVKELKATQNFSSFFGLWKRDIDLARKTESRKKQPTTNRSRPSISTSISSAFQVPLSSLSGKSLSPTKGKAPEKVPDTPRTSTHRDSSSSEDSVDPPRQSRLDRMQEIRPTRPRASFSRSRSSSSSSSSPVITSRQLPPISEQPAIASQGIPIIFGHNLDILGADRGLSTLESLPEDCEFESSPKSDLDRNWTQKRSASTATRTNRNANANAHVPPPSPPRSLSRYSTVSMQSTHSLTNMSAIAYLDELGMDYCLESPTPAPRLHSRSSVATLASVMTNSSVDAVIPRNERPSRLLANNVPPPLRLPEEPRREYELWSEDDCHSDDQGDVLHACFCDEIGLPQTPNGYPETPTVDELAYHFSQKQSSPAVSSCSLYSDPRSFLATSVSSGSTSSNDNPMSLSIKAIHEESVVMLRLSRNTSFDELRRKLFNRFTQTDKPTISESFAIALLQQSPAEMAQGGRARAGSSSSLGSPLAKGPALHFISSQDDWDHVVATHGGRILFRIIGSRE